MYFKMVLYKLKILNFCEKNYLRVEKWAITKTKCKEENIKW